MTLKARTNATPGGQQLEAGTNATPGGQQLNTTMAKSKKSTAREAAKDSPASEAHAGPSASTEDLNQSKKKAAKKAAAAPKKAAPKKAAAEGAKKKATGAAPKKAAAEGAKKKATGGAPKKKVAPKKASEGAKKTASEGAKKKASEGAKKKASEGAKKNKSTKKPRAKKASAATEKTAGDPSEANPVDNEGPWMHSAAKAYLRDLIVTGKIPKRDKKTKKGFEPKEVFEQFCKDRPEFKEYQDYTNFASRLYSLRKTVEKKMSRADVDALALQHDRKIFPAPIEDTKSQPMWKGSAAQKQLQEDIANKYHKMMPDPKDPNGPPKKMTPKLLYNLREVYHDNYRLENFRNRIYQEIKFKKREAWVKEKMVEKEEKKKKKEQKAKLKEAAAKQQASEQTSE